VEITKEVRNQLDILIDLVSRVDAIGTNAHHRLRKVIAGGQVGGLRSHSEGDMTQIVARFEMLDVSDHQESVTRGRVQDSILASLAYPSMTERYQDIIEAHPKTFEWVFENPTADQLPWSNFSEWLIKGSGVYWINGKAGSGKSTLFKHIFDDPRTKQYLMMWAKKVIRREHQPPPLCLATFFFWNSGSPEQKSQSGLLRALLYQVLSSCPDLISVILPELWTELYSVSIKGLSYLNESISKGWTLRNLSQAFLKLIRQRRVPLKLCFLVDGLDEFDGDHEEMAALFKEVTDNPDVKICLSSRPWVVFQKMYRSCPSLRLQDLTFPDIKYYVSDKFERNRAFRDLESDEPKSALLLRNEVVEKAEGVFLWVKIVVNSLLLGLTNEDHIEILRERLGLMPPELIPLYRHLMSLIDEVYLVWASKAFRIVRAVREFCSDEFAGPVQRGEGWRRLPIYKFYLAMAEDLNFVFDSCDNVSVVQSFTSSTSRTLTKSTIKGQCDKTRIHLTARCAGLLEIPRFEQRGIHAPVQFLHRTARDFLETDGIWNEMTRHAHKVSFDPTCRSAMLKATVLSLTLHPQDELKIQNNNTIECVEEAMLLKIRNDNTMECVEEAMLWAYYLDINGTTNETDVAVLDVLDRFMTQWGDRRDAQKFRKQTEGGHWSRYLVDNFRPEQHIGMISFAILYGLTFYVRTKVLSLLNPVITTENRNTNTPHAEVDHNLPSKLLHTLLTCMDYPSNWQLPWQRPAMVSTILSLGADPNYSKDNPAQEITPLSNMLRLCALQKEHSPYFTSLLKYIGPSFVTIMQQLVAAGGYTDTTTGCFTVLQNRFKDAEQIVTETILPIFPLEGEALLQELILQKNKKERSRKKRKRRYVVAESEEEDE
jgi:hypothetical protein